MLVATAVGRALVAFLMIRDLNGLLLFPEAFAMLVMAKAYAIAKSALVPGVVDHHDELVHANSRLTLISAVSGFVAAGPGLLALVLFGGQGPLVLAMVCFTVGGWLSRSIEPADSAEQTEVAPEVAEIKDTRIVLGRQAMGLLRAMVGFVTFLLAFALRGGDSAPPVGARVGTAVREALGFDAFASGARPAWHLGLVVAASAIGSLVGSLLAPRLRSIASEERILQLMLAAVTLGAVLVALLGGLEGAILIGFTLGLASTTAKQAFDAIVQRDSAQADHGGTFALFESRFQILWAIGAIIPVAITVPATVGYWMIALAALVGLATYIVREPGSRTASA